MESAQASTTVRIAWAEYDETETVSRPDDSSLYLAADPSHTPVPAPAGNAPGRAERHPDPRRHPLRRYSYGACRWRLSARDSLSHRDPHSQYGCASEISAREVADMAGHTYRQADRSKTFEAIDTFLGSPRGRALLQEVLAANDGELAKLVLDRIRRDPSWAEG